MTATITCNFYSYNTGNRCHQPATEAVAFNNWDSELKQSVRTFAPRCRRHAASDANKKYGAHERFDITDEMLATWAEQKAKSDAAEAVRRAEKAERDRIASEAYTARLWDEHQVEYEVVRKDEERPDWSRPISERAVIVEPRWLVQPIGTTDQYRHVVEVKVVRDNGRPDRVEIHNPSTMTPKAALKLAEAVTLAFGETK